jgi:hypothetical protein
MASSPPVLPAWLLPHSQGMLSVVGFILACFLMCELLRILYLEDSPNVIRISYMCEPFGNTYHIGINTAKRLFQLFWIATVLGIKN